MKTTDEIAPYWRQGRNALGLVNYAYALYEDMLRDCHALGPSTVLLSSEILLNGLFFDDFVAILKRDFGRVLPVIYVRDPVDHFRSRFQQMSKGGGLLNSAPRLWNTILELDAQFGEPVQVRGYGTLSGVVNWDVVDDFFTNVLGVSALKDADPPYANAADPAELTIFLLAIGQLYAHRFPAMLRREHVGERVAFVRNYVLEKIRGGAFPFLTSKLCFSDEINSRIFVATQDDREFFNRRLQGEMVDLSALGYQRTADVRIFDGIFEVMDHVPFNRDTCIAFAEASIAWHDGIILNGDRTERAMRLKRVLAETLQLFSGRLIK